jgi:hypothetical protein
MGIDLNNDMYLNMDTIGNMEHDGIAFTYSKD